MDISIIILSAGAGTRMKSTLPKVLHKISGREMIYYVIKEAKKLTNNINIVLYHEEQMIKEVIFKYFDDIKITIQDVTNFPGTGGALKNINFESDKVLVLNGDMPLIEANELKSFFEIEADIVMSSIKLHNPDGYGRVLIEDGEVKKIVEQKDANENELQIKSVNAGVYLFKSEILNEYLPKINNNNVQKEYYLTDIIELCVNGGRHIKPIFVQEENFKGVNSKFDLANAESIMQNRIKKAFMLNGVIMRMPETIYIESSVKIEGESIIENGVTLLGETKIVSSHIKTNTIIEDSEIIESEVGPMTRIRPKTILKECTIGNFVEIKKSNLFGVKAGHVSYMGDSEIGENTNIGAGVITCNYSGKSKYKTKIGKNVFVGSSSQLIAPVTIEDNTIIGAGTTLTNDVKEGELALSRLKQTNIKGFFYRFFTKEDDITEDEPELNQNFTNPITQKIVTELRNIGIQIVRSKIRKSTFLPGILVKYGTLVVDEDKLLYPGDLLHEAGHLAIVTKEKRKKLYNDVSKKQVDEIMTQAWSYAFAVHINLDLNILFHKNGYKGDSQWLIHHYSNGGENGVPMLEYIGLSTQKINSVKLNREPFPKMIKWLRD